jgi:WhiB family redox-sensing transcriptional regulator
MATFEDLNHPKVAAWMDHANCAGCDPNLFFPERGASTKEAKAVCAACVVRETCLEYAMAQGIKHGIWGGRSERERRRIRIERAQARLGGCGVSSWGRPTGFFLGSRPWRPPWWRRLRDWLAARIRTRSTR